MEEGGLMAELAIPSLPVGLPLFQILISVNTSSGSTAGGKLPYLVLKITLKSLFHAMKNCSQMIDKHRGFLLSGMNQTRQSLNGWILGLRKCPSEPSSRCFHHYKIFPNFEVSEFNKYQC